MHKETAESPNLRQFPRSVNLTFLHSARSAAFLFTFSTFMRSWSWFVDIKINNRIYRAALSILLCVYRLLVWHWC